jgi:hypothetical protein
MRYLWTEQLNAKEAQKGGGKESQNIDSKKTVTDHIRNLIARLKGRRR